jgi:hypothetical protein
MEIFLRISRHPEYNHFVDRMFEPCSAVLLNRACGRLGEAFDTRTTPRRQTEYGSRIPVSVVVLHPKKIIHTRTV